MRRMIVEVGWLMLLLATAANVVMSSQTNQPLCIPKERQALLTFKQTLDDTWFGYLYSWTNRSADQNCCDWNRITCDNQSNHVISIDTSWIRTVGGELDSSLAELQHLNHLDLYAMNIRRIPKFIGSLKELTYLDLADNEINSLPDFIGSLKELTYLDLARNNISVVPDFIGSLKELTYLNLAGNNISAVPKFIGSLKELTYLDLAWNNINAVPKFIGSLKELTYLGLAGNPITGIIPPQLGNLTKLQTLDLSSTSQMSNYEWISHLTSLETLTLSEVNFSVAGLQSFKGAPFLSSLSISNCLLPKVDISFLSHTNDSFHFLQSLELYDNYIHPLAITWLLNSSVHLTRLSLTDNIINGSFPNSFEQTKSLQFVDLSSNDVGSGVPNSLGNLTNLKELDLSSNNLGGTLHDLLQNLSGSTKNSLEILHLSSNQLEGLILDDTENIFPSLRELYLDNNQLEGPFLSGLKRFPSLEILDLDDNKLTGLLPDLSSMPNLTSFSASNNTFNHISSESIGKLDYLRTLDISSNSLTGVMNLQCPKLKTLNLSYNSALKFNSNWIPSFQLKFIYMSSCNLGPKFPSWLQTQTNIEHLDISNNSISGPVPSWFTNITSSLNYLNMSKNNLSSTLPNFPVQSSYKTTVDLSFNQFQGSVPPSLSINATRLFLSNNAFTEFRYFLCEAKEERKKAYLIDLSHNYLSGNLPDCWESFPNLVVLNLGYNMLSGHIPSSITMRNIATLQLRHNNFSGTLPSSFEDNTSLQVLDLTNNTLEGTIPPWIGEKHNLVFLSLRSNKFYGSIPLNLCHLTQIQILDLSANDLSGAIPSCIQNFTAMVQITDYQETALSTNIGFASFASFASPYNRDGGNEYYENIASITWKGKEHEYKKNLGLLRIIDLSSNKLNGEIPIEVAVLSQLVLLNLSRNNLSGRIPEKIGNVMKLEVLDLSHNKLYGPIPTSLAKVSFLSYLDLSYNQLSGRIPDGGTQLQTFNASIYSMNPGLCGPPLSSSCPGDETLHDPSYSAYDNEGDDENGRHWFDLPWFYKGTGVGFIIGFCGICGNLLINTSWRLSYFKLMHEIGDWLYVIIIVKWAVLRRKLSLH
ncbi:receptor-like protein EIX1 [Humulus lupulus]|uniref:receptor-like protein EIX1 n=1 Tax=Humulus lupulus TaxID=3486 RepID=UPI002B4023FC|nr:receptor-like protein EIX1 [Humulus lupulus]